MAHVRFPIFRRDRSPKGLPTNARTATERLAVNTLSILPRRPIVDDQRTGTLTNSCGDSRRAFQDTMQAEAITTVQELSGRRVLAFMSTNHIDPDLALEVFILEPVACDGLDAPTLDGHGRDLNGHGRDLDGHGPVRELAC
jgi:hypothetical protein